MLKWIRRLTVRERLEADLDEALRERIKYERGFEEYAHWLAMLNARIARLQQAIEAQPQVRPVASVSHLSPVATVAPFPPLPREEDIR